MPECAVPVPRSKKFGGIKRRGEIPAVSTTAKKKFGGVKEPVPRGVSGETGFVQSCPQNCPGEYVLGMWIHSANCPWAAVLWEAHGKKAEDWNCPYQCEPTRLPSGWTHDYRCPFWDRTGRTPIDSLPPRGSHGQTKNHRAQAPASTQQEIRLPDSFFSSLEKGEAS